MPNYVYALLDSHVKSIRLLSLLPGQFNDNLQIEIYPTELNLGNPLDYEALSYVWGNVTKEFIMFVNVVTDLDPTTRVVGFGTASLRVTYNLDEALRYLRYADKARTLWVDAICIDQSNVQERSTQVGMMGTIFKSASRVISWLGPGKDDSNFALETLRDIAGRVRIDENDVIHSICSQQSSDEAIRMQIRTDLQDERVHTALESLFFRPYFFRLWIRQEIHSGKARGLAVCGQDQLEWPLFGKSAYCWAQLGRASVLSYLIREICTSLELNFVKLLELGRGAQCSDPRDKIYAILGMLSPTHLTANTLIPDYSKPFADVYKEAFQAIMVVIRNIAILRSAGVPRNDNFRPTWSPDWSRSSSNINAYGTHAHGGTMMETGFPNDKLLQVDGCIAGTVIKSFPSGIASETPKSMSTLGPIIGQILKSLTCKVSEISETEMSEFSYICTGGAIAESFDSTHESIPDLKQIKQLLQACYLSISSEPRLSSQSRSSERVLDWIDAALENRYVIITDKGHIGIATPFVQPGDSVAAILGCNDLIVLTPAENGERRVLGNCYVHRLNGGEALLGRLPNSETLSWQTQDGSLQPRFRNTETGELSEFDPRIEWDKLEVDEQVLIDSGQGYYRMKTDESGKTTYYRQPDAAYLRGQGVPLETITLA